MVNLTLTEKGGSTNELSFDKVEVTVGRVRGNDIVLPKGNVSKHHCRLVVRDGEIVVEDLRSTNGTYVNGRKIGEATPLSAGDKVFVGDFIIRMVAMEAVRNSAPPAHPEAGSLSSAIPRRAPPPPPPHRGSGDDALGSGPKVPPPLSGRQPLPPPPPPFPAKRDTRAIPAVSELAPPPSSGPSDINLDDDDEDALGTPHPHFTVPPLKPAVQPAERMSDLETPDGGIAGLGTPHPARDHAAAEDSLGDLPSAEAPASAKDDDGHPAFPPLGDEDGDDIFSSHPAQKAPASHRAPDAPKSHEPSKPKVSSSGPAKGVARVMDRDIPEWLAHLIDGEGVTAAYFTGANQAEVQRHGRRESASVPASDLAGLGAAVRKLALKGSPKPASDAAAVNITLPDGMHIAAIFPPISDRLCVAIRRPVAIGKTIEDLVDEKVISAEMRQVLDACVLSRQNILVSGDRAACDSLLRSILWSVDRVARVALVSGAITPPASATSWLKLQPEGQGGDVIAAAVAMQPEYLVVDAGHASLSGEVLGECNLGLNGVILSVVARSTNEALHRLQGLANAQGAPVAAGADLVASSIDVIVQASVLPDGSLKVVEIAEPKATLDGQLSAHALLTWIAGDDGEGSFTVTGAHSTLAAKLSQAGSAIPPEILNRQ
jgi:pilus assembly protein CpaF